MLEHILPMIPQHKIYVEPFFGGGAVFFAKGKSYLEVINDINDNVVNFFRIMQTDFDALLKEIECTPYSESLHRKAWQIYQYPRGHRKVVRAWAFWMVTNHSFRTKPGGGWKYDNGTSGSHQAVTNRRKIEEFQYYRERLLNVQISSRDASLVIKNRDSEDTFIFLDPPYPRSDQGHYKGYTVKMLMDMVSDLPGIKGKFLLSNYALPELIEYSNKQNWNVDYFDQRLSAPKVNGRRKTEVLISNYRVQQNLFS